MEYLKFSQGITQYRIEPLRSVLARSLVGLHSRRKARCGRRRLLR